MSRASALVLDVQTHYLDRLLLTPVRRTAILIGQMAADVAVAAALTAPILIFGAVLGVRFEAGPLGVAAFVLLASLRSLAFAGFGYAIALKTGNPAAVNSTFLLFFPFLFLTSSYVPRSQLSGWLSRQLAGHSLLGSLSCCGHLSSTAIRTQVRSSFTRKESGTYPGTAKALMILFALWRPRAARRP